MDCKDITRLRFFQLIEKGNDHSQRSISQLLNISLGNVNSIVKSLVQSGCVQVHQKTNNRVQYQVTEKGAAEKMSLTYRYLGFSLAYCNEVKGKLDQVFKNLCLQHNRSVVLYGAGDLADMAFSLLQQTSLVLVGVIDKDRYGLLFHGLTIMHPSEAVNLLSFDKIIITSLDGAMSVQKIASELDVPVNKLITIN